MSFLITDTAASDQPLGVLTGDFVFAGDVGRPDLLERAAGVQGTMELGARTLFRSLQSFKRLPPHLMLWPSHGAGSACGKSLGAMAVTTLGYETLVNHGLAATNEEATLLRRKDPAGYQERSLESIAVQVKAMLGFSQAEEPPVGGILDNEANSSLRLLACHHQVPSKPG